MEKQSLLFDGNEKQIYSTDDPHKVILHFKDVACAYNNIKRAVFPRKGIITSQISALLFDYLNKNGVYTHFIELQSEREQLCYSTELIPLEVVVRNYIAGSLADRLNLEEGTKASSVIVDLNYNSDELGDPLVNDTQVVALNIVSKKELETIYEVAYKVNDLLTSLCEKASLKLIDFKLEFGRDKDGKIILIDEISPDTSRFWDAETDERFDKDRFRQDLGYIVAHYEVVLERLQSTNA